MLQQQYISSIKQLFIYFITIGFTFIVMPKNDVSYIISRFIQGVEILFFIILFIQHYKNTFKCNHTYNIRINLWWFIYTINTYLQATNVGLTPIFKWLNVSIFLLLGSHYWQVDFLKSLKLLSIVFSFLIYLNAILLALYPDGLWIDQEWLGSGDSTRYLFGNYNQIGFVCLLGITIKAIHTFFTHKGYFSLSMLTLVSIISVLTVGSMTSTVGLCIMACYLIVHKFIKKITFAVILYILIYLLFITFVILLGSNLENISIAANFIENVLSKEMTFSGRTGIWSNAINLINQRPWTGYGVQPIEWNITNLGGSGTHNIWLMLLLQGGIIICSAFVIIVLYVIRKVIATNSAELIVGVVSICVLLLMSLFETYNLPQIFLLLQLVYYSFITKKEQITIDQDPI